IGLERLEDVIAEREAEHVPIEGKHIVEPLDREHRVAHAERAGPESRDVAAGPERLRAYLGAMKRFEPVADGIGEDDEVSNAPLGAFRHRSWQHAGSLARQAAASASSSAISTRS